MQRYPQTEKVLISDGSVRREPKAKRAIVDSADAVFHGGRGKGKMP